MCGIAGGNFPGRMEAECLGSSRVVRFNLLAVCKYEEYIIIIQATIKNTSKKEERKRLLVGYVLHITHICHQRLQSPSPQSQPLNRLLFRSSWFYCVILNVFSSFSPKPFSSYRILFTLFTLSSFLVHFRSHGGTKQHTRVHGKQAGAAWAVSRIGSCCGWQSVSPGLSFSTPVGLFWQDNAYSV